MGNCIERSEKACAIRHGWITGLIAKKRSSFIIGSCGLVLVLSGYCSLNTLTAPPRTTIEQRSSDSPKDVNATSTPDVLSSSSKRSIKEIHAEPKKWIQMTTFPYIFAYSAFFDPRSTLGSVRIITVMDSLLHRSKEPLQCVMKGDTCGEDLAIVTAELAKIGQGVYVNERVFIETIITCPLENEMAVREVSVICNETESLKLHVENISTASPTREICTCVSASYGNQNASRLIEWLEMLKILQISYVFVYNNSISNEEGIVKVFNHYKKSGFLYVRQSEPFLGSDTKQPHVYLHMAPVLNDCMYRNMNKCKRMMVIDFDEVIIPRKHANLVNLLDHLDTELNASVYVFSNVYFFTDKQPMDVVKNSTFLTHKLRLQTSPKGASVKYIMDPKTCTHAHNHICWRGINMTSQLVPEELATNNHYKQCHLDTYLKVNGSCRHFMSEIFLDETMLNFRDDLISRIFKAHSEIFRTDV